MLTLLRREFVVNVSQETAWKHLAQVEEWPSWAKHISQISLSPSGELTPASIGIIHLRNGIKSRFRMAEFNPYRNWKWVGPFLWLTIHYDHIFEPQDGVATKLIWVVEGEGFGVSVFGRIFAAVYQKNLDKAIPLLIAEMNALEE